jgi:hypothetical protein
MRDSPTDDGSMEFDGTQLDTTVWSPYYLPHWSSRAASGASYELDGSSLRLFIPPDQGLWCGDDHQPPLRVSGIQSGNYSGPVGSTVGQQPYRDGLCDREEQEPFWGWTPAAPARIELRARADLSPRSMVSLWMVGLEDGQPVRRCAGPPAYPMQLMLAVFDFPEWSTGSDDQLVPSFTVDYIR